MNRNDEYDFDNEDGMFENAFGVELNIDFDGDEEDFDGDEEDFDGDEEDFESLAEIYYSLFPRFEDPKEMEENIILSLQNVWRNEYYQERFDAGLLVLAVNKDNLRSSLGTKDEYEDAKGYDLYDVYDENGINLRHNLVAAEIGCKVIDIIPVKKIVAKYFSDYTEDIYMQDVEVYKKELKEAVDLHERRNLAYKKWHEGTALKREGLIKEAAEALEISVENRVPRMPLEDIFTSLAHCYRLLHDVTNEIRVLNIAIIETSNPKFEKALQRALNKI